MERSQCEWVGVDQDGIVGDMKEKEIYDVLVVRKHVLRSAVDMALILFKSKNMILSTNMNKSMRMLYNASSLKGNESLYKRVTPKTALFCTIYLILPCILHLCTFYCGIWD